MYMNTNLAEKLVGMDGKPLTVIHGRQVKLRADGKPKETKSNAKKGRSTWVDPIRDKEDIKKCVQYLQDKIDNEPRADYRKGYARNKLYFCIATFSGFRVSDLIGARPGTKYKCKDDNGNIYYEYPAWSGLKWQDIYCKDGKTFRKEVAIKEVKTGNMRKVPINNVMQRYFTEYVEKFNPDTESNNYIFVNRQKERLNCKTIDNMIKEVIEACKIEGTYSTHSLRKTYVYQTYMSLCNKIGEQMALSKTMEMTGHRNMCDLLRYLGLNKQNVSDITDTFEDYMSDIF